MNILNIDITELHSLSEAAKMLIGFAKDRRMFLFNAEMGAGKTTFIKFICKALGSTESLSSPTYSIVNEYQSNSNLKIFHFDLYRLKSTEELFELGFEDYLVGNHYMFIEWPELAMPFLDSYVSIIIHFENNKRYLRAEIIGKNL